MGFETGGPGDRRPEPAADASSSPGVDYNFSDPVLSFLATANSIIREPATFFRGMVRRGSYLRPLVFALICAEFLVFISGLVGTTGAASAGDMPASEALISLLLIVLLAPIVVAVILFGTAAICHTIVLILIQPSGFTYETTFRGISYSMVAALPAAVAAPAVWVPLIGAILSLLVSLVVTVYVLCLTVVSIREVYTTTTGRAMLVVLLSGTMALLICVPAGAALFFP